MPNGAAAGAAPAATVELEEVDSAASAMRVPPPRVFSPADMWPRGRSPEGLESTVCLLRADRISSIPWASRDLDGALGGAAPRGGTAPAAALEDWDGLKDEGKLDRAGS